VWGSHRLESLTNADIRGWAADLQDTLAPRTARKILLAFRQLLAAAVDDRRLATNPANGVPLPADHGTERLWMTLEQAIALRDAIDPRYRALVLLGYWCGLRFGELTALRRSDVDVALSRIHVRRTAQQTAEGVAFGPPKTAAGRRSVPVATTVMRELSDYMDTYTPTDPEALVITSSAGTPLLRQNFLRRTWRPALAAAGLPPELTPHSMRHGYASLLIAGGFSVKEVSQWCGHASTSITLAVYAHVATKQVDDAPDRLDALLGSFPPPES
jgi:integrase